MIREDLLSTQIVLGDDLLVITIQDSDYYIFYDYLIGEKTQHRCTSKISSDDLDKLNNIISKDGKKFELSLEEIHKNRFKFNYLSSKFKGQRDYGNVQSKESPEIKSTKKEYGYQYLIVE